MLMQQEKPRFILIVIHGINPIKKLMSLFY